MAVIKNAWTFLPIKWIFCFLKAHKTLQCYGKRRETENKPIVTSAKSSSCQLTKLAMISIASIEFTWCWSAFRFASLDLTIYCFSAIVLLLCLWPFDFCIWIYNVSFYGHLNCRKKVWEHQQVIFGCKIETFCRFLLLFSWAILLLLFLYVWDDSRRHRTVHERCQNQVEERQRDVNTERHKYREKITAARNHNWFRIRKCLTH